MMRRLLVLFVLFVLAVAPLRAQSIRGRVLDAEHHQPLAHALAELRDTTGATVQRTLTDVGGGYSFMARYPGRYSVVVSAMGSLAATAGNLVVPDEGLAVPDQVVSRNVPPLPELLATVRLRACGRDGLRQGSFGMLVESARNALQLVDAAFDGGAKSFPARIISTSTVVAGSTLADTSVATLDRWPIERVDPDTLRRFGFARDPSTVQKPGMVYYGLDAQLLVTDWFLEEHCFTLKIDRASSSADSLHLRFEPRGKSDMVDLAGELVFDRATMSLRRLEYHHVNLPLGMPASAAGGSLAFGPLSTGRWLSLRWSTWQPVEATLWAGPPAVGNLPRSSRMTPYRTIAGSGRISGQVIEVVPR